MVRTEAMNGHISEFEYSCIQPEQKEMVKQRAVEMVEASNGCSSVIFIDKSARVLGYLFREVYPTIYPDNLTPQVRFINVGREKAGVILDFLNIEYNFGSNPPARIANKLLDNTINSVEDVVNIFGENSSKELQDFFNKHPEGKNTSLLIILRMWVLHDI